MSHAPFASRSVSVRLFDYSNDQQAVAEYRTCSAEAERLSIFKRSERRALRERADAAWQRALASGVDFSRLPKPEPGLRTPDRTGRRTVGHLGVLQAAAGSQTDSGQRAAEAHPSAIRTAVSAAGGAMGGMLLFDAIRGAPALDTGSSSASGEQSSVADGVWKEHNGELFYEDAQGDMFLWDQNGGFHAMGSDGFMWSQAADGSVFATDGQGNDWLMNAQGDLYMHDDAGNNWLLGDDGGLWMNGADGSMYALGEDGNLYGFDDQGNPEFADFGSSGLDDFTVDDDGGGDGGWDF